MQANCCIYSESIFSPSFSLTYTIYNFYPYSIIIVGTWDMCWFNGKRRGEGGWRVVFVFWACFSLNLSRTISRLKGISSVNLKKWQIVMDLKVWLQND